METEMKIKPFNVKRDMRHNGIQMLFKFENGFGASVVSHEHSYGGNSGLWELAVIVFDTEGEWDITYDSGVAGDVVGWLSDEEVQEYLEKIKELDKI